MQEDRLPVFACASNSCPLSFDMSHYNSACVICLCNADTEILPSYPTPENCCTSRQRAAGFCLGYSISFPVEVFGYHQIQRAGGHLIRISDHYLVDKVFSGNQRIHISREWCYFLAPQRCWWGRISILSVYFSVWNRAPLKIGIAKIDIVTTEIIRRKMM